MTEGPPDNPQLTPEEAAGLLDAINQRFAQQSKQILMLSLAVLALAGSVALIQMAMRRADA